MELFCLARIFLLLAKFCLEASTSCPLSHFVVHLTFNGDVYSFVISCLAGHGEKTKGQLIARQKSNMFCVSSILKTLSFLVLGDEPSHYFR